MPGERKGESGEHRLFSFLTTESNDVVRPIHAKAMPVLLTHPDEWDIWLEGSIDEAIALQQHKILSTSSAISSQQERTAFRASAMQTWREVVAGNVTEPVDMLVKIGLDLDDQARHRSRPFGPV